MITAIDTNILLDVLVPDAPHGDEADRALAEAVRAGALVISEPVYAELSVHFVERIDIDRFLADTNIRVHPSSKEALHRAGAAWRQYARRRTSGSICAQCGAANDVRCERCGAELRPRQHVLADFLIGAHAVAHANRLLTRDRGYYATYFPDLVLG